MSGAMAENVVYSAGQSQESLDDWLQDNKPSMISDVDWIWVRRPEKDDQHDKRPIQDKIRDEIRLLESWDRLQSSGRKISPDEISVLAKTFNVTAGKWLFHVDRGLKADHLWSMVARAVVSWDIPATVAKISPNDFDEDSYAHVVCVYNKNYLDYEEVLGLENGLRKIGLKRSLYYKPDIYTKLGIYRVTYGVSARLYTPVTMTC